jgi:hypothetical protein
MSKRNRQGHYCRICGQYKANEKFSGSGHARHVCKACAKRKNKPTIKIGFEPSDFIDVDDVYNVYDTYGIDDVYSVYDANGVDDVCGAYDAYIVDDVDDANIVDDVYDTYGVDDIDFGIEPDMDQIAFINDDIFFLDELIEPAPEPKKKKKKKQSKQR